MMFRSPVSTGDLIFCNRPRHTLRSDPINQVFLPGFGREYSRCCRNMGAFSHIPRKNSQKQNIFQKIICILDALFILTLYCMYQLTINGITKNLAPVEPKAKAHPVSGFTTGYELTDHFGQVAMYIIDLEDFTAIYFDFTAQEDVTLQLDQELPALELYVALLHPLPITQEGQQTILDEFQYGFRYCISPKWLLSLERGHHYAFVVFQFAPTILKEFLPGYPSLAPLFVHMLCHTCYVSKRAMHFTGEMLMQLNKIWNPSVSGPSQNMYLGLLLKTLFIYAFREKEQVKKSIAQNANGIERKVRSAAEIINNSPETRYTITGLSRRVNTNPFSLSKGFRIVFQQSVFEYITSKRLEKAVRLLLDTKLNEDDIAQRVGYSTSKALMKTFKKNFGCTPGTVRAI
jgi:AraC-like DNA-binding protein